MSEMYQPGRELDKLVAEAMNQKWIGECPLADPRCPGKYEPQVGRWPCLPPYSTDITVAMEAWKWLEVNYPQDDIYLKRGGVYIGRDGELIDRDYFVNGPKNGQGYYIQGENYAHSIALAVVIVTGAIEK